MAGRPPLLFIAPIMPAESGNGLAMRAGVFLDALAQDFAVTLLVVPVAGGGDRMTRFVTQRTHCAVTLPLAEALDPLWALASRVVAEEARVAARIAYPRPALCRYATTPCLEAARSALTGKRFRTVHVMRSYLAPYAAPFLPATVSPALLKASLDLDDDEATTHRRLARLHAAAGRVHDARVESAEAAKYERLATQWLPRFSLRIVCAAEHAAAIAVSHPEGRTAIVPNTVRMPPEAIRRKTNCGRILFVGNLSYLPNVEGICRFVRGSLPRLTERFGGDVVLRIAGSAPAAAVLALANAPKVEIVANPPDVTPHYAWADLVVIPLAAGGGTRIKLLEAFVQGVPVVATSIGAEGIAAEDREHLLLADSDDAFTAACTELLADTLFAERLAARARRLVEQSYAHEIGVRIIREAFAV